jgi:hypothetical protein
MLALRRDPFDVPKCSSLSRTPPLAPLAGYGRNLLAFLEHAAIVGITHWGFVKVTGETRSEPRSSTRTASKSLSALARGLSPLRWSSPGRQPPLRRAAPEAPQGRRAGSIIIELTAAPALGMLTRPLVDFSDNARCRVQALPCAFGRPDRAGGGLDNHPGKHVRFPLPFNPQLSYKTGGRCFGAPRARGRRHAACDLIAPLGTEIYAIDAGVVVVASTPFYRNTSAMAIRHKNGQIVRYCEILTKDSVQLREGATVTAGQLIAHVGKMFVDSMLHFELYAGTADGDLTNRSNPPYQRRSDLLNPTPMLDRLAWLLHV